jgi:membrane protease YdiL (CAAX protease family)
MAIDRLRITPKLDWALTNLRPSILLIFIVATNSIVQLAFSIIFYFFLPGEISSDTNTISELSLLFIIILSNLFMIGIITKILPFFETKDKFLQKKPINYFKLILVLIFAISFVEIFTSILNLVLDFVGISPSISTPYDDYFGDPLIILVFTLLIISVGPIFEELVYRKYIISAMSSISNTKPLIIFVSALIFAFSHTAADIFEGSLRYTLLHFSAISILGIILGIIYTYWGLKGAIIFHSSWNFFSLAVQILADNNYIRMVDLIILLFIGISLLSLIVNIYTNRIGFKMLYLKTICLSRKNSLLILLNFIIISLYVFFLTFIQLFFDQNILTSGFILLINIIGILFGIMLINKEKHVYIR